MGAGSTISPGLASGTKYLLGSILAIILGLFLCALGPRVAQQGKMLKTERARLAFKEDCQALRPDRQQEVTQRSTLLKSGRRHLLLNPLTAWGPLWEWELANVAWGLPTLLSLTGSTDLGRRRWQQSWASAGGSREQSVASVGGWCRARGAHSQIEWEGDNLFFQSGRAGFHGCVFIPEQAQFPKALTPPTPPAGRPWLLFIEKKRP